MVALDTFLIQTGAQIQLFLELFQKTVKNATVFSNQLIRNIGMYLPLHLHISLFSFPFSFPSPLSCFYPVFLSLSLPLFLSLSLSFSLSLFLSFSLLSSGVFTQAAEHAHLERGRRQDSM